MGYLANVIRGNDAPSAVLSGTFKYLMGDRKVFMLRDGMYPDEQKHVKESWGSSNNGEAKEINVYQVPDVTLIWRPDDLPVSIWRTRPLQGYFNPGDIAVYGRASPGIGFLLKGLLQTSLKSRFKRQGKTVLITFVFPKLIRKIWQFVVRKTIRFF